MAQYKCKRCGNLIEVENGAIIAVCDNCLLAQPIVADNMTIAPENKPASTNADVADEIQPLVRRAFLFLEDGEWEKADEYFERILDKKPECAEAYLGKIMTQFRVNKREDLTTCEDSIKGNNYDKIMRFGDDKIKAEIKTVADAIEKRISPKIRPVEGESLEQEEIKTTEYETAVEVNKTTNLEGEKKQKKTRNLIVAVIAGVAVVISFVLLLNLVVKYNDAVDLMEARRYSEAIVAFEELGGYKDSKEKIKECNYNMAVEAEKDSDKATAAILFGQAGDYKDAEERSFALWDEIAVRETVSARAYHTVGLKKDGVVVVTEHSGGEWNYDGEFDVSDWENIIAVSAGDYHTVGLKKDGTVVAVGDNGNGQCDVSDWEDIVAIFAGYAHTLGLKKDGTVVAVGKNDYGQCDVEEWKDIVAISAGIDNTVGLKKDGTVVAVGDNDHDQCDVEYWNNIVAISAGWNHTVGLKKDGTVVSTEFIDDPDVGYDDYDGQCDVDEWKDIIAISAGYNHTVGLKKDGTVVAVGDNDHDQCDVEYWNNIVAISAGDGHTVGLKKDGTVIVTDIECSVNYCYEDYYYSSQCDVDGWKNIKIPK